MPPYYNLFPIFRFPVSKKQVVWTTTPKGFNFTIGPVIPSSLLIPVFYGSPDLRPPSQG